MRSFPSARSTAIALRALTATPRITSVRSSRRWRIFTRVRLWTKLTWMRRHFSRIGSWPIPSMCMRRPCAATGKVARPSRCLRFSRRFWPGIFRSSRITTKRARFCGTWPKSNRARRFRLSSRTSLTAPASTTAAANARSTSPSPRAARWKSAPTTPTTTHRSAPACAAEATAGPSSRQSACAIL